MISAYLRHEEAQFISGPEGKIEVAIAALDKRFPWGIVCHPHSLYGGSMQNKVVTTTIKAFQEAGMNTLRFNFRGVGKSEGSFDHGDGELQDLLYLINWLKEHYHWQRLTLAGFSFGSYVAFQAACQLPLQQYIAIAPPVENFPFKRQAKILSPWILVQGDQDEIVSAQAVYTWAKTCEPTPTILQFPEATHFFHGKLGELKTRLEEVLLI